MKNKKTMKDNEVILHGECMVSRGKIPANAIKLSNDNKQFVIVAPSETTGNHHVVDLKPGIEFFQGDDGKLYMQSTVETDIRCVIPERHDAIAIPPGTYEFGSQMEYDPFAARLQKVRD